MIHGIYGKKWRKISSISTEIHAFPQNGAHIFLVESP